MKEQFTVRTYTPERIFIKVYRDFLNSGLLSGKEQIIFIHLKQYINFMDDNGTVSGNVYPTLATLAKNVKMSEKTIRTILQSLEKKGILEIERQGQNKPNIYTINDSPQMWKSTTIEELKSAVEEIKERQMIEFLKKRGYCITKERELDSSTSQSNEPSPKKVPNLCNNHTTKPDKSQELEKYTLKQIQQIFGYEAMLADSPDKRQDIDSVMSILHTTMNTTKETIRISGENKPATVVIGKLMKLDKESILYAIGKFSEQTGRIKNPGAYMLTILYSSPEQCHLWIENRINYNMAHIWQENENPPSGCQSTENRGYQ